MRNEYEKSWDIKHGLLHKDSHNRPGIGYEEIYSLVVDTDTFRFLISLAIYIRKEIYTRGVQVLHIHSSDSSEDLFIKNLPTSTFQWGSNQGE